MDNIEEPYASIPPLNGCNASGKILCALGWIIDPAVAEKAGLLVVPSSCLEDIAVSTDKSIQNGVLFELPGISKKIELADKAVSSLIITSHENNIV